MKLKTSIIIIILSCLGVYLLYYNFDVRNINNFNFLLNISGVLIIIGIIGFIIYLRAKESRKIKNITVGILIVSLGINSYVGFYKYQIDKMNKILSEYYELKTCEEMENRFAIDLKKGELKYFHFGIGSIMGMKKLMESNYDIEYYSMGCLSRSEMVCYNKLVSKHLKENYNKSISDIYKETDIHKLLETE